MKRPSLVAKNRKKTLFYEEKSLVGLTPVRLIHSTSRALTMLGYGGYVRLDHLKQEGATYGPRRANFWLDFSHFDRNMAREPHINAHCGTRKKIVDHH